MVICQKEMCIRDSPYAVCVDNFADLDKELKAAKEAKSLRFIEVKCALGSRADLGLSLIHIYG